MKVVKNAIDTTKVLAMGCGQRDNHPNCQGKHSN